MRPFRFFLSISMVLACSGIAQQREQTPVILITVDTLRADRLASYGYPKAKTPNIDALAQEGVQLDNAYVQTPITLPSHASILTGTYPMFHKLQTVVGQLRDGVPTLAMLLKEKGYATGAFVGSTVLSSRWMLNRGFDTYDDYFDIQEGLRQVDFDRVERRADDVMTPALRWLDANARQQFFLWVHLYDPHDPYEAPAPFGAEFKDRPYDGEVAYTDFVLGKLFDRLKSLGVYQKSLIVFTSDHGEMLGEHDEMHHGFFIYEASLRIPLIFKFPGERFKGTRLTNTVRSVDIAPTILQQLGIPAPRTNQGDSLLATIAGKRPGVHLPVYAESHYPRIHFNWSPLFGYIQGDFKYIDAPQAELYNLKSDPGEKSNLIQSNKALAAKLRAELLSIQTRYSAADSVADSAPQPDPETVEKLKSLGYIAMSAGARRDASYGSLPDPKAKIEVYNRLNRGITLSRRGMREQAIEILEQVARLEPGMPIAHFLLGMEYFQQRLFLRAVEEFQETLKHNPDSNVAMFNLARSYLESGQTEKAEVGFKFLVEREPANFGARHYLSLTYARRARYAEAAEEAVRALKLRPDFVDGYNNLGSFYLNLDRVDPAIDAYEKAIALQPEFLLARVNLALAYLKKGALDDAIKQSQEVLNRDAKRPLAHYYLGQALLAKGMKEKAREAFQKAKELNPRLNVPSIAP